jgi:ABC-type transporter Mla MlaB component
MVVGDGESDKAGSFGWVRTLRPQPSGKLIGRVLPRRPLSFRPPTGLYVETAKGWAVESAMAAPQAQPNLVGLVIDGPIDGADVFGLADHVRALLEGSGADPVVCDVAGLRGDHLAAVAVLARLQLTARRLGGHIQVRNASPELHDMLALVGLCEVVGARPPLGVEMGRETKYREEARGVEEERDAADPIA